MSQVHVSPSQQNEICKYCTLFVDESCPLNTEPALMIHGRDRIVCKERMKAEEVSPCYLCHVAKAGKCPSCGVIEPVDSQEFTCRWKEEYDSQVGVSHA